MEENILQQQQAFFKKGETLPLQNRLKYLKKLKQIILQRQGEICQALKLDLGKSPTESYMCEIGLCLEEISYFLRNLKKIAKDKVVPTSMANFYAKSFIKFVPRGSVLIVSPWNYPFLLSIEPLIDAVAAGNTVVLKPSAYSFHSSSVIQKILQEVFPPQYVAVVKGGRAENQSLFSMKFDYIFFTGSASVGKEVLQRAAQNLIPVSLELGGKSPCIVDETANIALSARRIVFGKFLNCGQTCVAPDYILCQESIKEKLIFCLKQEIVRQFGSEPLSNENYGKIINDKHFLRLQALISEDKVVFGGKTSAELLKIEPTVMDNVSWNDKVMQEEIFGPVLPVLTYQTLEEAIHLVQSRPHPLALYIFSKDKRTIRRVTQFCYYGGGCINDVILHLATPHMPFGGIGESGMGNYHGAFGFDTFSHKKSILDKKTWIDIPTRYQPYSERTQKILRWIMR